MNTLEILDQLVAFNTVSAASNLQLIDYVEEGGGVYLHGGVADAVGESAGWSTFLNNFGLAFAEEYNQIFGDVETDSTHPIFEGVESLATGNGQSIIDLDPSDDLGEILVGAPKGTVSSF